MENMTVLASGKVDAIKEDEMIAVRNIKRWVQMICRKKCTDTNKIYVSPYTYTDSKGEVVSKTIICISDNLPNGPIVQIAKPLAEVNLGDLLGCYKLINYCKGE